MLFPHLKLALIANNPSNARRVFPLSPLGSCVFFDRCEFAFELAPGLASTLLMQASGDGTQQAVNAEIL